MVETVRDPQPQVFFYESTRLEVVETHDEFFLISKSFSAEGALALMRFNDIGANVQLGFLAGQPVTPMEGVVEDKPQESSDFLIAWNAIQSTTMHRYIKGYDIATSSVIDSDQRVVNLEEQLSKLKGTAKTATVAEMNRGKQDREVIYSDTEKEGRKSIRGELVRIKYSIVIGRMGAYAEQLSRSHEKPA